MIKFEFGRTYFNRFIGDADSRFECTVIKRTAKTVTITTAMYDQPVRRTIRVWNGVEEILPFGKYSLAPVLRADRVKGEDE